MALPPDLSGVTGPHRSEIRFTASAFEREADTHESLERSSWPVASTAARWSQEDRNGVQQICNDLIGPFYED
jgi:hypothetical protein